MHSFIRPAADNQSVFGSKINWLCHSAGQAALLPDGHTDKKTVRTLF